MTEELSPSDRSSLSAERGPINMAVGGLMVFDPEPALTRAMVAARIQERIHLIPRLRQRLEEPPLGIANPVWTDDTSFDIDWHVRQGRLVILRVYNDPTGLHPMDHPLHVHGQRVLVVRRNGVPNHHLVWKDTVIIPAGQVVDLLVENDDSNALELADAA